MRKYRKFGLENFMISVKNALASNWLLTKESQGEAEGETKDFNGSQEAKGFGGKVNFLLNWRMLGKQTLNFAFPFCWLLASDWLLTL